MSINFLDEAWRRQTEFNANFVPFDKLNRADREAWTKDYILYIQGELIELAQNLSWKIHRRENLQVVHSNIVEELVDIFKYWNSICLVWEVTPEKFIQEWLRKTEVVEQRFRQEYARPWNPTDYKACVVVDIDGVLADYVKGFLEFVCRETGVEIPEPHEKDFYSHIGRFVGYERAYELKHQFRERGQKLLLDVLPGSVEFMNRMRQEGAYLLLMSARPYKKYKRIMADTLQWLKAHSIPYDSILWDENKEDRIIKEYPFARFVVEDSYDNALRIASKGIPVYLRDTTYNQGPTEGYPIKRFQSYEEIKIHVTSTTAL